MATLFHFIQRRQAEAKKLAMRSINPILKQVPLRRNHRAERRRFAAIKEALVNYMASATIGRPPGKASRFSTGELGNALARSGVLADMAVKQVWTRTKRIIGGEIRIP